MIKIAQDLGYVVEESSLIRTDLYLADEVFMTGTAAEVTPVRSVDDIEIGVGPVTLEVQKAYLDTVNGRDDRWSHWLDVVEGVAGRAAVARAPDSLSAPWLDEREEQLVLEGRGSGRLRSGPWVDASRRRSRRRRGAPYAAAVSRGTAGLLSSRRSPGIGPGDEVITTPFSFVAPRTAFSTGREAGLRRHRPERS